MHKKNIASDFLKDMLFIRSYLVEPYLFITNYSICEVTELKIKYLKVVGTNVLQIFAMSSRLNERDMLIS